MKKAIYRGTKFLSDFLERNISLILLAVAIVAMIRSGITVSSYELIALLFVPVVLMTIAFRFIRFIVTHTEEVAGEWLKSSKMN